MGMSQGRHGATRSRHVGSICNTWTAIPGFATIHGGASGRPGSGNVHGTPHFPVPVLCSPRCTCEFSHCHSRCSHLFPPAYVRYEPNRSCGCAARNAHGHEIRATTTTAIARVLVGPRNIGRSTFLCGRYGECSCRGVTQSRSMEAVA